MLFLKHLILASIRDMILSRDIGLRDIWCESKKQFIHLFTPASHKQQRNENKDEGNALKEVPK